MPERTAREDNVELTETAFRRKRRDGAVDKRQCPKGGAQGEQKSARMVPEKKLKTWKDEGRMIRVSKKKCKERQKRDAKHGKQKGKQSGKGPKYPEV